MTLQRFDEAMTDKLKSVFSNVSFAHEDRYREDATNTLAQLTLPLVTVWRVSNIVSEGQYSTRPFIKKGFRYNENGEYSAVIRSLPLTITYQIDIISDKRSEVDAIFRELAMFLLVKNNLTVHFDVGELADEIVRDFTITLVDNQTNSDYTSIFDVGRLYRETINVEIRDAELIFLFSTDILKNINLHMVTVNRDMSDESAEEF